MLRCIFCNRSERITTLDMNFKCCDTKSCAERVIRNSEPPAKVCIWFDAACQGANKAEGQLLGIGIYVTINGVEAPEYAGIKDIGHGSNNDGEWTACMYAMKMALRIKKDYDHKVIFRLFSDSLLVVDTFNGVFKLSEKFKTYYDYCKDKSDKLGKTFIGLSWLPREQNQKADDLSKEALKLYE